MSLWPGAASLSYGVILFVVLAWCTSHHRPDDGWATLDAAFVGHCRGCPGRPRLRRSGSSTALRCLPTRDEDGSASVASSQQDWRTFRARLVQATQSAGQGWAYESPLIEKGSVLLAAPGDDFTFKQQYFHKAIILIIRHDDRGSTGLILNRPTALSTHDVDLPGSDLPQDQILKFLGLSPGSEPWKLHFAGDCQGLGLHDATASQESTKQNLFWEEEPLMTYRCLHALDSLAGESEAVIHGIYLIDAVRARVLVELGKAKKEDFLVLVGYCGWGPGQLQEELDQGSSWTLVAADQKALVSALWAGKDPSADLNDFEAPPRGFGLTEEAGVDQWWRLYNFALEAPDSTSEEEDAVLNLWMASRGFSEASLPRRSRLQAAYDAREVKQGSILRASPGGDWALGAPAQATIWAALRPRPAQYLHKGVVWLSERSERGSTLVLLNGPKMAITRSGSDVLFGGSSDSDGLFTVPDGYIWGCVKLPPGVLEELMRIGALQLAKGTTLQDIFAVPTPLRWEAAGGKIETLSEAAASAIGDAQRRRWYRFFLGIQNYEP
eukprot:TRINITY_DN80650_c0_g1_i1.p1 TRINITY_DN80650_c0_g1~~TRINITY_DN80650_c0_g1_i1.p1  ORF type:complete len:552 (-),score=104.39 TRINITY_DN80650_c0_g1_i1:60-1715(-)